MIDFEKFVSDINRCFIKKDVEARATVTRGGFILRIEERDIQFDENLVLVGQGTDLMYQKPKAA